MSQFHSNAAVKLDQGHMPLNPGIIYKAFEQSEDERLVARLNYKLAAQCGSEFKVSFFSGDQLKEIDSITLTDLADCYAQVFNESWGEDWTRESALEEIMGIVNSPDGYLPLMTIMQREGRVVGFSWGVLMDKDALESSNGTPFSSSPFKRHESISVAKYWLDEVANKGKLISIRELGVLKEYRQDKTPYLCLPIFHKAQELDGKVAFLRTKISSKAFKWSLGIGFVPLQLFMVDGLLLMHGSVKYAAEIFDGLIDSISKKSSQRSVISNIKRYLCQY